jgi:hypothetical protein
MPDFGLQITSRSDLPAVIARWQREISELELQHGYLAIMAAGDALGCGRWLLDLRRREELASPALTTWMNTDFFPRLARRYAAPVRIAFLISPLRAAAQPAGGPAASPSRQAPTQDHQTALFTDEAAAYNWLAQ